MTQATDWLFSEFTLKNLRLRNRMVLAPMTRTSAEADGRANARMAHYYAKFAQGEFGLLITEGTYPDEAFGQGYSHQPGMANDAQRDAWRPVVEAVHQAGSPIILQIMHAGAQTQGNRFRDEVVGPSAVRAKGEQLVIYGGEGPYPQPRAMSEAEIQEAIQGFADAARRAKEAGFDGVEIHGANGYLIDEFLTVYLNQRSDAYGGPVENRVRFAVETIQAVRQAVGADFVVGIRLSQGKVSDYHYKWPGGADEARVIFSSVAKAGVDYIHVTEYDITKPAFGEGPTLAELAREYGGVTVIANGGLDDPAKAATVQAADLIALGKPALANRDWPKRAKEGETMADFDFSLLQPRANIKDQEI